MLRASGPVSGVCARGRSLCPGLASRARRPQPGGAWPPTRSLARDVSIGAFVAVGEGASIGDRTVIYPNVTIGPGARIGTDCVIHSNVSIRERVTIGNRVILQNGVVIGGDGYGFVRRGDGTHEKIPQVATVVIEDDVELGANTTVDRPAVGETRIKAGTKIDNLVQIGHGVTVGRNVLLAAQVGIAGSTDARRRRRVRRTGGRRRASDDRPRRGRGRTVGRDQLARCPGHGGRLSRHRQPRMAQGVGALPAPAGAETSHRSSSSADRASSPSRR